MKKRIFPNVWENGVQFGFNYRIL